MVQSAKQESLTVPGVGKGEVRVKAQAGFCQGWVGWSVVPRTSRIPTRMGWVVGEVRSPREQDSPKVELGGVRSPAQAGLPQG